MGGITIASFMCVAVTAGIVLGVLFLTGSSVAAFALGAATGLFAFWMLLVLSRIEENTRK